MREPVAGFGRRECDDDANKGPWLDRFRDPAGSLHSLKHAGAGVFLSCIPVVVAVAVLELAVRTWAYLGGPVRSAAVIEAEQSQSLYRRGYPALAERNQDRIFELRPNARQRFATDEFTMDISTNSRHLRDREHSVSKPAGEFRMAALGDSFTFGWGVQVNQTWWAALAGLAAHDLAPRRSEVVNFGVYYYTFDQQVQRIEEIGLAYSPDLIVRDFFYPHVITIYAVDVHWTPAGHALAARTSLPAQCLITCWRAAFCLPQQRDRSRM